MDQWARALMLLVLLLLDSGVSPFRPAVGFPHVVFVFKTECVDLTRAWG